MGRQRVLTAQVPGRDLLVLQSQSTQGNTEEICLKESQYVVIQEHFGRSDEQPAPKRVSQVSPTVSWVKEAL